MSIWCSTLRVATCRKQCAWYFTLIRSPWIVDTDRWLPVSLVDAVVVCN